MHQGWLATNNKLEGITDMPQNLAKITITGRLTATPELKTTKAGRSLTDFDVAVNRRKMTDGEWQDAPTTFFSVRAFDKLAENLSQLGKGKPVMIAGDLVTDSWTTERDEVRTKIKLIADVGGIDLSGSTVDVRAVDAALNTSPSD